MRTVVLFVLGTGLKGATHGSSKFWDRVLGIPQTGGLRVKAGCVGLLPWFIMALNGSYGPMDRAVGHICMVIWPSAPRLQRSIKPCELHRLGPSPCSSDQ